MQEADFGAKFQTWWATNKPCPVAALEYKVTKTNTFNLTQWHKKQPQQYVELVKATTSEGVMWKISDLDPRTKPFDAFFISESPAFLVVWYHRQRRFFIIPVHEIPDQTSISYLYCLERWTEHELLPEIRKQYTF
jgi:prophage antirepressor-like protein